jgi:hypothetical protein
MKVLARRSQRILQFKLLRLGGHFERRAAALLQCRGMQVTHRISCPAPAGVWDCAGGCARRGRQGRHGELHGQKGILPTVRRSRRAGRKGTIARVHDDGALLADELLKCSQTASCAARGAGASAIQNAPAALLRACEARKKSDASAPARSQRGSDHIDKDRTTAGIKPAASMAPLCTQLTSRGARPRHYQACAYIGAGYVDVQRSSCADGAEPGACSRAPALW